MVLILFIFGILKIENNTGFVGVKGVGYLVVNSTRILQKGGVTEPE